jgi:hypothetical protein
MRAFLLANATATSLNGFLPSSAAAQSRGVELLILGCRNTAVAPALARGDVRYWRECQIVCVSVAVGHGAGDEREGEVAPKDLGYRPGMSVPMVEPERIPTIAQGLLDLGYTDAAVGGVLGGNLMRVAGEVWK